MRIILKIKYFYAQQIIAVLELPEMDKNMKKYYLYAFMFLSSVGLFAQETELERQLFNLPDVVFEKIDCPEGFEVAYKLLIRQPVDHNNPHKGYFYQRAFLSHRGFHRPTVIVTEGYARSVNRPYELTGLLEANQIDVEHRFFGVSIPDTVDYDYLNFEQLTADLHHINQLFRNIYRGKWVSTGISKGGTTTIFYRYFYPDDVDVSVPYVAPVNLEYEDKRIYQFLDTVGSKECREKIYKLQVRMLENREEVLPLLRWYGKGAKLEFSYLEFEEAFEYTVLEFPFSFWQWGHKCEEIPGEDIPLEEALEYFNKVIEIDFFADAAMKGYASHYYQSASEMGYYGYETKSFKGLLKALPMKPNPLAIFTPGKMQVEFDGTLTNQVYDWLKDNGNRFAYIYGGSDTWSATSVPPSDKVDALWLMMPDTDHGKARILNMTQVQRRLLISRLEKWLNMEIEDIFAEEN